MISFIFHSLDELEEVAGNRWERRRLGVQLDPCGSSTLEMTRPESKC